MASNFQTKIKEHFVKKGYKVLKVIRLSENGFPDLHCIKKGCDDVWIESKEEKDTLKPLQMVRISELISLGKIAFCLQKGKGVIFGSDEFKDEFKNW